jgi:ATP-binding cassette subfamily C protein
VNAVRRTFSYLTAREWAAYIVLVAVRALSGLLDVVGIALIGFLASVAATHIDSGSAGGGTVLGFAIPQLDSTDLVLLVVLVLGVFVVKAVTAILLMRAQALFVARVETRNAAEMTRFLLEGPLVEAKRYSKAEAQYAITASATYAFTGLMNNVASLVAESFLLLVITATFFLVNPAVALFTLVYFGLVVLVIQVFIGRSLKRAARNAVAGTIATNDTLSDTLDAFREVSVLHKQRVFSDRITTSRSRIARSNATLTFQAGMPRYVVETALILGVVILITQQFMAGNLTSGLVTVGVFLAGGVRMMASLLPVQNAIANLRQNSEQAQPALDLLARAKAAPSGWDPVSLDADPRAAALGVDLSKVGYRYPGGSDTIRGVSLSIAPGSLAAIIGPSGAGKTTLVDLLLGLIEPDRGTVAIGGLNPMQLRRAAPGAVAYVPQRPGIVSGTIAENIALGVAADRIDRDALERAVDAAYLRAFVDSLPAGLDTSVGKQADALSGGQVQRIGIARALYSAPRLLVLDEATSGLDAGSETFISESLAALHGEVTVIVIAHRLSTVQHADVVNVIEDGRLIATGDFAHVQRAVPLVAEYVKLMSFDPIDETLEIR